MINLLRLAAAFVLIAMLAVTTWASSEIALWKTPREVVLQALARLALPLVQTVQQFERSGFAGWKLTEIRLPAPETH